MAGSGTGQERQGPPDPLARDASAMRTGLAIGLLILVAAGAAWLGRQSRRRPSRPRDGEKLASAPARRQRTGRRTPGLSEELQEQEAGLVSPREVDSRRLRREIGRLRIGEASSGEDER